MSDKEQQLVSLIQDALTNNEDFRRLMAEYINASTSLISQMLKYIHEELDKIE